MELVHRTSGTYTTAFLHQATTHEGFPFRVPRGNMSAKNLQITIAATNDMRKVPLVNALASCIVQPLVH